MQKKISFLTFLFFIFSQTVSFGAVTVQDLKLPENFYLSKNPDVKIASVQENAEFPGFLTFSVTSPDGNYTINGLTNLQNRLREIDVMEQLKAQNDGVTSGVTTGAIDSVKDTGRGLAHIATNPVDSVEGVGKAAGKLGGKVAGVFRKKEEGEKGDNFFSSAKRQVAKELGVDVYSRNPHLQEKLDAMAKSRMGGKGIVMAATFFVPVGAIASAVMTAGNLNSGADKLVNDSDRGDLFKMNKKALLGLGFPEEKTVKFLDHPYYTPREITYIRFYLEKLSRAEGFQTLLEATAKATSEIPAAKILHEMQIAANYADTNQSPMKLVVIPEGIILASGDKAILITAYDYVDNSALGSQLADKVLGFRKSLNKKSAEIWNGGAANTLFAGAVLLKGIKVQRMCLFKAASAEPEV